MGKLVTGLLGRGGSLGLYWRGVGCFRCLGARYNGSVLGEYMRRAISMLSNSTLGLVGFCETAQGWRIRTRDGPGVVEVPDSRFSRSATWHHVVEGG